MLSYDHIFAPNGPQSTAVDVVGAVGAVGAVCAPASSSSNLIPPVPIGPGMSEYNIKNSISQLTYKMSANSRRYGGNSCAFTEDFDFCDDEIKRAMTKKTWATMDKCFKWTFICKYLKTNHKTLTDKETSEIKERFVHGSLKDVEFNNKERVVVTLNTVIGSHSL